MRDIWDEMKRMQDEMDMMFDSFFRTRTPMLEGPKATGKEVAKTQPFRTAICDIKDTDKAVIATFEVPGAEKDNIDLNVTETSIEVKAQRRVEKEAKDEKKGYYSYTSSSSQFYRHLPLPAKVLPDSTVAVYKDGVLKVTMPKQSPKKEEKGKRIDIR